MNLTKQVYGVCKEAFQPPVIERDFDNIEEAKNIERRYAIPLKFGDVIQFNSGDVNHTKRMIHRIRREKPIYQTSSNDNGPLLRVGGCIDPRKPTTFWTPLETVSIPMKDACRAEPDVWMYAWIRVEVFMKSSQEAVNFYMTFDSFADFEPADQGRVAEAPWQRASLESKFVLWSADPSPCDEDLPIDLEPRKDVFVEENKWAEVINKQLGLYVGERLLLCKDLPQYDFIIPLIRPIACAKLGDEKTLVYPTVGEYFHFGAIWSNHHQAFLVTELVQVPVIRGHTVTPSGNLLVRVRASGHRGLFTDQNETLGFIDDPNQLLTMFEFHPAVFETLTAMVEVRAVRATENRSVRYRVVKVIADDENMIRFDLWARDSQFAVGPFPGVVVSKDTVLSPKHPNVYFRLPNNPLQNFPVGSGVRVRGRRMHKGDTEITVTETTMNPELSIQKFVLNGENTIFQVPLTPLRDHVQLAESEHFGLVDMRGLDHPIPANEGREDNRPATFLAWVRESARIRGSRRACTMMEVFSLALNTPILPITSSSGVKSNSRVSTSSSKRDSQNGSTGGSGSNGSTRSLNSISTNRFIGPSARRPAPTSSQSSSTSGRSGQ